MNLKKIFPTLSVVVVFVINLYFIVSIHDGWNNSVQKYVPLQSNIKKIEIDLATAHLWFEEAISGDQTINVQDQVFEPLQYKEFKTYLAQIQNSFTDKKDLIYVTQLQAIEKKLNIFLAIAKRRWVNSSKHTIGSDLDQEFDETFNNIISSLDDISLHVANKIDSEIDERNNNFYIIIASFIIINFIIFSMLFLTKRKQEKYAQSLFEANERVLVTLRSIGDAVITTDMQGNIT